MPYQQLNLEEAAAYLHISSSELEQFARKGDIPSRVSQNRYVFLKRELHDWQSKRLLDAKQTASEIHQAADILQEPSPDQPFLSQFLLEQTIDMDFKAPNKRQRIKSTCFPGYGK